MTLGFYFGQDTSISAFESLDLKPIKVRALSQFKSCVTLLQLMLVSYYIVQSFVWLTYGYTQATQGDLSIEFSDKSTGVNGQVLGK